MTKIDKIKQGEQEVNGGVRIIIITMLMCIFSIAARGAMPEVQQQISKNGIKFWEIEDNYLPIISIKVTFTKSGAAYDPANKLGLANMAASLLVEGAGNISGIEYMQQLESLASNINFGADEDNFYVSLTCLKENLDQSMHLLALALISADFTPDAISRVRKNILSNILKLEEDPVGAAAKIFKENYFAGHPYARQIEGDVAGVNAIKRQDLITYVTNHFTRANMIIGVAGSVNGEAMADLLDKHLAALPQNIGAVADLAEFIPANNAGKIIRIEQNIPQSVVVFGFAGPKRKDADFYNTYVMNHIFGGGSFESRLMQEVREKRGLAYTVYTSVQTYNKAGVISGYVATKNQNIEACLQTIKDEIAKIHKEGITAKELADSQDYLIGSFPLRMTKNSGLASFLSSMQYDNLGADFLINRNGYIKNVNIGQANAAAAKYLNPDNMLLVVVGKNNDL